MGVSGSAPYAGGQGRRNLLRPGTRQGRVLAPGLIQCIANKDFNRSFAAAGQIQARRIDHATPANNERLFRQIRIGRAFYETYGLGRNVE